MYKKCRLCVLWFLVFVFLSLKTFPDLREDRLEPSSRRDFGGCRSYDEEADGAPKSQSQLILLLPILVCVGRREGMGQVPCAWNALPPLLHLANSYSSFKTQLKRHLLQEAYSDFTGCLSLPCPVLPFLCLSNRHAVCGCHLSLSPPSRL